MRISIYRIYDFLALIFIFSLSFKNIIFEVLWLGAFISLLVSNIYNIKIYKNITKKFIIYIVLMSLLLLIQLFFVKSQEMIPARIFGLTRVMCAASIGILLFIGRIKKMNICESIINIICVLNVIYALDVNAITILMGSENYIAAINTIIFPYVAINFNFKNKFKLNYLIYLFSMLTSMLMLDSKTYIMFILIELFYILYKKINRKSDKALIVVTSLIIGIVSINIITSVMKESTSEREQIMSNAITQFSNSKPLNQILGSGNNLVQMQYIKHAGHNFIIEVLLIFGIIGLAIVIFMIINAYRSFKFVKTRRECIAKLILIVSIANCLIHPFFTTGFLYQSIIPIFILKVIEDTN